MKTMHEEYGDGTDHLVCEKCGLCLSCNDCTCEEKMKKEGKCSLCDKNYSRWGHNPEPLKDFMQRCCDECNETKVVPERIRRWKEKLR